MDDTPPTLNTVITPEIARTYLINVAETLNDAVIPVLDDPARIRAIDCLRIVTRLVADSSLSEQTLRLLIDAPGDAAGAALREGEAVENANEECRRYQRSLSGAAPRTTRNFDHAELESYLRRHPLGGERLRITQSKLMAGGRSKVTILVTQEGACDLPGDFVVRQDWASSATGKLVEIEFELLQHLYNQGVMVPRPLLLERTGDITGNPFMMVSRLPGSPVADHFMALPASERPLMQIAEQLGRVHGLDTAPFARMPGIVETNSNAEYLRTNLAAYQAVIAEHDTVHSRLVEQAINWLERNADRVAALPCTVVHGDFGFHNALVDADSLSGILDWEMAHLGNPAYDLGYLRHAVTDDAVWDRFMAHYRKGGGLDIPSGFVDYFTLYTGVWYHQLQLHIRSRLMSGAVHDMPIATICADFSPMVMVSLSRTLHRVLG